MPNSQTQQFNSGEEKHSIDVMPFVKTPLQNTLDEKKTILNFRPKQTLENNCRQVPRKNRHEAKNKTHMRIEQRFAKAKTTHFATEVKAKSKTKNSNISL